MPAPKPETSCAAGAGNAGVSIAFDWVGACEGACADEVEMGIINQNISSAGIREEVALLLHLKRRLRTLLLFIIFILFLQVFLILVGLLSVLTGLQHIFDEGRIHLGSSGVLC